jgi:hypothetical protein
MTDEQLKKLARITLLNTKILGGITDCLYDVYERVLPLLPDENVPPDEGNKIRLLHNIEQLQAVTSELSSCLSQSASELGVEWPDDSEA